MENKTIKLKNSSFTKLYHSDVLSIDIACSILALGGIIVYPTDTIYGFGCDAKNDYAIKKLNSIKRRKGPMTVLCPNTKTGLKWMLLPEKEKINAKIKLHQNNTIIAPVKKNIVSNLITGKNQTLGIRISNHPFCTKLTQAYSGPITTTSVNRSGSNPHTNPDIIEKNFSNEINLLIQDGIINKSASKIYLFDNNKWINIR